MLRKLEKLLAEVRAGRREGSVVSIQTIESLSLDDKDAWRQLRRELKDADISTTLFLKHRYFIISWFRSAIARGAFEEVGSGALHNTTAPVLSDISPKIDSRTSLPSSTPRVTRINFGKDITGGTLAERRNFFGRALKRISTRGPKEVGAWKDNILISPACDEQSKLSGTANVPPQEILRGNPAAAEREPRNDSSKVLTSTLNTTVVINNVLSPIPKPSPVKLSTVKVSPIKASNVNIDSAKISPAKKSLAHDESYKSHEATLKSIYYERTAAEEANRDYARMVLKGRCRHAAQKTLLEKGSSEKAAEDSAKRYGLSCQTTIHGDDTWKMKPLPIIRDVEQHIEASFELEAPSPAFLPAMENKTGRSAPLVDATSGLCSEKYLLCILQSLDNLEDLFSAATVNRAFYRTYKCHELPLIKNALRAMSPAAWELREISPIHAHANGRGIAMPQLTPSLYLQQYTRDIYTMVILKSTIIAHCGSFLRSNTSQALWGGCGQKSTEIDDAFWRIFTFCQLFGYEQDHTDAIHSQESWLNGGKAAAEDEDPFSDAHSIAFGSPAGFGEGNGPGLTPEQIKDMTEIWSCLGVLYQRELLTEEYSGSTALHHALEANHQSILHFLLQQYLDKEIEEANAVRANWIVDFKDASGAMIFTEAEIAEPVPSLTPDKLEKDGRPSPLLVEREYGLRIPLTPLNGKLPLQPKVRPNFVLRKPG